MVIFQNIQSTLWKAKIYLASSRTNLFLFQNVHQRRLHNDESIRCIFHQFHFTYQSVCWCSVRAVCCVQSVPLPEPRSSAPSPSALSSAGLASAALPFFRSECLPARLPLSPSTPFPSEFQTMSEQENLSAYWKVRNISPILILCLRNSYFKETEIF